MEDTDLTNLDNQSLIELLATLEGMDQVLAQQESSLKEGIDNNEK